MFLKHELTYHYKSARNNLVTDCNTLAMIIKVIKLITKHTVDSIAMEIYMSCKKLPIHKGHDSLRTHLPLFITTLEYVCVCFKTSGSCLPHLVYSWGSFTKVPCLQRQ